MHGCTRACAYTCVDIHTYTRRGIHTRGHTHTWAYTHTCAHTHMWAHTHTHEQQIRTTGPVSFTYIGSSQESLLKGHTWFYKEAGREETNKQA